MKQLSKERLRKIHGSPEPTGPADEEVLARRRYHEAAALWLAKSSVPLQVFFASIGFFVILLPVLSKTWRNIIEGLPILAHIFHSYSTLSGMAMANLYIGMLMAVTKPYWGKHSPSGHVVLYKTSIAPLLLPRTRKEEISFWIEAIALTLFPSVWLFLPFGVLAYFINIRS
jgi:hypothetical protein